MTVQHLIRAVRFPNGDWVAGCSCAEYMSPPYGSHDEAIVRGRREHRYILEGYARRRA